MALNWNIENVENWKQISENDNERVITDVLVWATLVVGIREIKSNNVDEFYARVHLVEVLQGAFRNKEGNSIFITKDDIQRRVGMTTNSGTYTRIQFNKNQMKHFYRDMGVKE